FQVQLTHPECSVVQLWHERMTECQILMQACLVEWDGVNCWPAAQAGEMMSVPCPPPLQKLRSPPIITRNCTRDGWSSLSIPYYTACLHLDPSEEREYFSTVKLIYTIGYGVSLGSLCIAMLIFTIFKLLCTRTCIHLNLFSSFILRAVAVFVKDAVLFSDETIDHCTISTVLCKAAVTFFQYCVLANFYWLLVEGLYLQTLLIFTFTHKRAFVWWYALIGWMPTVTIITWTLLKHCWDDLDSGLWWIIKTPILCSVFVNFIIFVNISRIIVLKIKTPDCNTGERPLYRLVKPTLLLIPLFGVHYVVFAVFPEHVGLEPRLFFELVLGSFQGFTVALLYCFLNSEVQTELKKGVARCWSQRENNVINMATQDFMA
uniref:Growth hormone releasing hormone receptor 2 n=1 Tax=Astyanax mexicanus TaxID=7994 RepID=W5LPT4_ASTMX